MKPIEVVQKMTRLTTGPEWVLIWRKYFTTDHGLPHEVLDELYAMRNRIPRGGDTSGKR